eukprot:g739.t1
MAELSHLREALVQIAQEKISADAINAMLEDAAQGLSHMDWSLVVMVRASALTTGQDSIGALKDTSYLAGFCGSAPHVHHMEVPAEPRFPGSIEDFREKHKDDASALDWATSSCRMLGDRGMLAFGTECIHLHSLGDAMQCYAVPCRGKTWKDEEPLRLPGATSEHRQGVWKVWQSLRLHFSMPLGLHWRPRALVALQWSGRLRLEEVEQSYSDNIFMGFIYGIAKGKFPYKISLRVQTPEFLCFDDPLQCSPRQVGDKQRLVAGLALVKQLEQIASEAALEQYWNHEAFRETIWAGQKRPTHWQALQGWAVMGFNFPPSMFQLHLQFIHLPLFPFHYNLLQRGEHLTHGRFFPLEYVKQAQLQCLNCSFFDLNTSTPQALALGDAVRMEGSCDITSLIERVKTAGVDYDEIYRAMLETIHTQQRKLTPWREADFQYRVVQGKVFEGCTMRPEVDPKEVQKKDAHAMCNYGRPYKEEKPSGQQPARPARWQIRIWLFKVNT